MRRHSRRPGRVAHAANRPVAAVLASVAVVAAGGLATPAGGQPSDQLLELIREQPLDRASAGALEQGNRLFEIHCARCHGLDGVGGEGPNLMRENLRGSTTDEALVQIVDEGLPGTDMPGARSLNTREVHAVSAYVRSLGVAPREDLPGDPEVGRELYEATLCSTCHVVNGEGIAFGPDLSDIGLLRGGRHLRESIRAPEASVAPRYRTVLVEDAGGAETMGVRMNEDTFTIQILDQAGRLRSFRKTGIRRFELLPEESLMMSYADFSDEELDDLVAYLATLRGEEEGPSR